MKNRMICAGMWMDGSVRKVWLETRTEQVGSRHPSAWGHTITSQATSMPLSKGCAQCCSFVAEDRIDPAETHNVRSCSMSHRIARAAASFSKG